MRIDAWPSSLRLTPGHIKLSDKAKNIKLGNLEEGLKEFLKKNESKIQA